MTPVTETLQMPANRPKRNAACVTDVKLSAMAHAAEDSERQLIVTQDNRGRSRSPLAQAAGAPKDRFHQPPVLGVAPGGAARSRQQETGGRGPTLQEVPTVLAGVVIHHR